MSNIRAIEKGLNRKAKYLAYDVSLSQNTTGYNVTVLKFNKIVQMYNLPHSSTIDGTAVDEAYSATCQHDRIDSSDLMYLYLPENRVWLYINPRHGMELDASFCIQNVYGSGTEYRGNENGILFYAEYIMCSPVDLWCHQTHFQAICDRLEVVPGLYDRGAFESTTIPYDKRRSISHDNISAISSICRSDWCKHARNIYVYGLMHLFTYNNIKPRWRAPMNPSNYSIWAYNGGSWLFYYFFLPFYFINLIITCLKPKENTSSKLLYFVELYPHKYQGIWGVFWDVYAWFMRRQYGYQWLHKLMKIYFKDPKHPILEVSKRFSAWIM